MGVTEAPTAAAGCVYPTIDRPPKTRTLSVRDMLQIHVPLRAAWQRSCPVYREWSAHETVGYAHKMRTVTLLQVLPWCGSLEDSTVRPSTR